MVKQAEILFVAAMTMLICSSSAPAAIFEMQHALPGADTAAMRLRLPGGGMEGLYKTASIDHAGEVQFPSLKTGIARSEDLLWVAIGDAGLLGLRASPLEDTAWYLFDADRLFVQNAGHGNVGSAPKESTAREIWAVILVGAGLIWFQLRRKTRHGAIRFTAS
jgi:hypothetical protein